MALLRAVQPDAKRPLVREALDILTPALPTRLAPGPPGDLGFVCMPSQLHGFPALTSGRAQCHLQDPGTHAHTQQHTPASAFGMHRSMWKLFAHSCPAAEAGEFPKWSRYVKKVSNEEAGSLHQLVHIWATIVCHADMFTSSRGAFTPQIVHSLQRLGEWCTTATLLCIRHSFKLLASDCFTFLCRVLVDVLPHQADTRGGAP